MTIFEKIIAREIPAHIVWEDDYHIAFLDIKPIQAGHVLLVPKKPVENILDMNEEEYGALWLQAKKLALPLQQATGAARIGFVVEGFGVDHVHIHLVPINNPHELDSRNAKDASPEELEEIAEKIKNEINKAL